MRRRDAPVSLVVSLAVGAARPMKSRASDDGATRLDPPLWDHQHHPLRALSRSVQRNIPRLCLPDEARVVDLGCGDRPYEPLFVAVGATYVGCDLDGACDVRIVPGEPVPLPDASADAVVSFQVLEHVWDVDAYLAEAKRLLKPKGRLLLSTHGTWLYHPHPTDFHRWTREGLVRQVAKAGFVVEHTDSLVGPLAWTTQFRLLGLRHALMAIPGGKLLVPAIATAMNLRMSLEDAITPESILRDNASMYLVVARPA